MKRISIAALGLIVGASAGCIDMGLEGNIELAEAENRQTSELVAAVTGRADTENRFIVDGRLWVPSGLPQTLRASDLRAVGSADGRTVHARSWDQAPYDALFVRATEAEPARPPAAGAGEERWVELRPVLGRTGRVPTAEPGGTGGHAGGAAPADTAGGHGGH